VSPDFYGTTSLEQINQGLAERASGVWGSTLQASLYSEQPHEGETGGPIQQAAGQLLAVHSFCSQWRGAYTHTVDQPCVE